MICVIYLQAKRDIAKLVDSYGINDCKTSQKVSTILLDLRFYNIYLPKTTCSKSTTETLEKCVTYIKS